MNFCKVHHSADHTNLLCLGKSSKKLENIDVKKSGKLAQFKEISLSGKETEHVI